MKNHYSNLETCQPLVKLFAIIKLKTF